MWVRFLHDLQINLERATCKEQGLPAKQIVHLVWIGVGIQPLRKDCINTAYDGLNPNWKMEKPCVEKCGYMGNETKYRRM